jgi:hypothetical protein
MLEQGITLEEIAQKEGYDVTVIERSMNRAKKRQPGQ